MVSLNLGLSSTTYDYSNYFTFYMRDSVDNEVNCYFILDPQNQNALYNKYEHDYEAADADKKIMHINDGVYDTLIYLQSLNGVYSKLKIPGLKGIKDDPTMDNVAINKARLIFPYVIDGNTYTDSTITKQIYTRFLTTSGKKLLVHDLSVGSSFYDGTPAEDDNVYNINLATFVQQYLNDKADTILPELEVFCSAVSSYNAILRANTSHIPVKFELTYTKF
jgi:hypothetical protein